VREEGWVEVGWEGWEEAREGGLEVAEEEGVGWGVKVVGWEEGARCSRLQGSRRIELSITGNHETWT
jgi:hypothetical protein